ncbi:lysine-specific histone demethylase [Scenedesmus sp. PABB004]|nr:lysine-specific histone demethylase [Scenedesmus sp. PABB004]
MAAPAGRRGACRQLLAATLVGALLAGRCSARAAGPASPPESHYDVIILGVGMAGVAAARALADAPSRPSTLVLEARPRAGGRLHSVQTREGAVDLGAMWIHDAGPGNALWELARELRVNLSAPQDYSSADLVLPDGRRASLPLYAVRAAARCAERRRWRARLRGAGGGDGAARPPGARAPPRRWQAVYASFQAQVRGRIAAMRANASAAALNSSAGAGNASAGAAAAVGDVPLSEIVGDWRRAHPGWRPEQELLADLIVHQQFEARGPRAPRRTATPARGARPPPAAAPDVCAWRGARQTLLAANVSALSAAHFGNAKVIPAVDVLTRPGMDALVTRQLPGLNVSLDSTVTAISQDGVGVSVTLANGTTLRAAHALVTLPLGVLKARRVAFDPPLPLDKERAIAEMGMGLLDKVVLVFPRVFWRAGADFLCLARRDGGGRWSTWLNYEKSMQLPVLVALNTADTARQLEHMSDAAVALATMYGGGAGGGPVPAPLEAHVTRWGADPLARGAYSYYATGNPRNITRVLAQPHGRVLFAGEATSDKPATVLGALLSGRREACRLLRLLGRAGAASPE